MSRNPECRNLVVLLGDQLSPAMSALTAADPAKDRVLLAEVMAETTCVPHHKKKIAFILSAMRHFAEELRNAGWTVDSCNDGNGRKQRQPERRSGTCLQKVKPEADSGHGARGMARSGRHAFLVRAVSRSGQNSV